MFRGFRRYSANLQSSWTLEVAQTDAILPSRHSVLSNVLSFSPDTLFLGRTGSEESAAVTVKPMSSPATIFLSYVVYKLYVLRRGPQT